MLATLLGCQREQYKPNIEKAISDLTDKFTQLPKGKTNPADFYKLTRTVFIGEKNIQLQLRSAPDSINDRQQIIIIINPEGQYYTIPFFSNTFRDFWKFEFDNQIPTVESTKTTFEREFTTALDALNLNDTLGTGVQILHEILISLINCEKISENDSSHFTRISPTNNIDLPQENFDSCYARYHRNFEAIKKELHPSEYYFNYNAYWDKQNKRIYQLNTQKIRRGKKFELEMKVYRQDCVVHLITM